MLQSSRHGSPRVQLLCTFRKRRPHTCLLDEEQDPVVPTVITSAVYSQLSLTSAIAGGIVTSTGGADVTARGVCWSTLPLPTLADSHSVDGGGTGSFSSNITGLAAGTSYYVRAYATNSVGTAYGNQVIFTTPCSPQACPDVPSVTDYDGNIYNTDNAAGYLLRFRPLQMSRSSG